MHELRRDRLVQPEPRPFQIELLRRHVPPLGEGPDRITRQQPEQEERRDDHHPDAEQSPARLGRCVPQQPVAGRALLQTLECDRHSRSSAAPCRRRITKNPTTASAATPPAIPAITPVLDPPVSAATPSFDTASSV